MRVVSHDPLEILLLGPLDIVELAGIGVEFLPACPFSEMMDMLNNLNDQYLGSPERAIIPLWWQKDPQKFQRKMSQGLSYYHFEEGLSEKEKQVIVLQSLLDIWIGPLGRE